MLLNMSSKMKKKNTHTYFFRDNYHEFTYFFSIVRVQSSSKVSKVKFTCACLRYFSQYVRGYSVFNYEFFYVVTIPMNNQYNFHTK